MIAAVIDTNVLVSGFVRSNPRAAPALLIDAWRANRFSLVISEHILNELLRTFTAPYFARRMTREQRAHAEHVLRTEATLASLTPLLSLELRAILKMIMCLLRR